MVIHVLGASCGHGLAFVKCLVQAAAAMLHMVVDRTSQFDVNKRFSANKQRTLQKNF